MENPFFRSQWNQGSRPLRSPSVRGIPVQPIQRKAKLVSIPVHFVGTEADRSASALKIQKVFRGFLVRKSVKKIACLRCEVEEIERSLSQSEAVELFRRDAKERLRVNETLMALLFKLDSVRGIDSGVRDCRKAVIKKVIALQERVDSIAAGNQIGSTAEDKDDTKIPTRVVDRTLEINDSAEHHILENEGKSSCVGDSASLLIGQNQASDIKPSLEVPVHSDNGAEKTVAVEIEAEDAKDPADAVDNGIFSEKAVDESIEVHCPDAPGHDSGEAGALPGTKSDGFVESAPDVGEKMDITEVRVDSEVKADEEACVVKQIVEDQYASLPVSVCVETNPTVFFANPKLSIEAVDENTSRRQEDGTKAQGLERTEGNLKESGGTGWRDDHKHNTDFLERRMMEDNNKMMGLMTQLFERNEMQTRMLSSLTQRVEQLERAFVCDRLRRKKKRRAVGAVDDGLKSTLDQNKCEKR